MSKIKKVRKPKEEQRWENEGGAPSSAPPSEPAKSSPLRDPQAQIVSILGTLLDGFRSLKTTA